MFFKKQTNRSMPYRPPLHVPEEKPYRGPEKYENGGYTYSCSVEGDFDWFQGKETICYRGKQIYECVYHGGLIK